MPMYTFERVTLGCGHSTVVETTGRTHHWFYEDSAAEHLCRECGVATDFCDQNDGD